MLYLYHGLVGFPIPCHGALVSGSDFDTNCGTLVRRGTSIMLLSSNRSRESNLDHTDIVGIHPFSGCHRISPPIGTDLPHLPLASDLRRALSVLPVLLAE